MMSPTSLMAVGVTITDMVDSFGCGSVGLRWFGAVEDSVSSEPIWGSVVVVVVFDLVTVLFLPVVDGGSNGVFRQD